MKAGLRRLWVQEPVLVGLLVPVLTTAGLTATQANSVQGAVEGAVAIAAQLATAFGVRTKVKPDDSKTR